MEIFLEGQGAKTNTKIVLKIRQGTVGPNRSELGLGEKKPFWLLKYFSTFTVLNDPYFNFPKSVHRISISGFFFFLWF